MPKDRQGLTKSREYRRVLLAKWGNVIPSSVFRINWSKSKNIETTGRSYSEMAKSSSFYGTEFGDSFGLSKKGARMGGLSRFPQDQ